VAFFVLGGFLCGTILAYLRLDDRRWYANAWTWLVIIPILIAVSLTWLGMTGNRLLRRTMQLALVMGLIVHLLLLIFAIETNIFGRIWDEVVSATQPVQREEVRVPEYSSWQHDPERRAERDFEQPVETALPEPDADDVEPQEIEEPPTVVEPQPVPVPDPVQSVDPAVVKRKMQDQATPRQREQMSKLSRKVNEAPAQPVQSVTIPDVVRRAERQQEPLDATSTPMLPQRAASNARRQMVSPQPRAADDPSSTKLARQAQDQRPETQAPSTVTVDRQLAEPRVVPRSDVQSPARPAIAQETQADALRPNNTLPEKQQTRSPNVRQMVDQPAFDTPRTVSSRVRTRQQPAEKRPVISRAPQPLESQRVRNTSRPDVSTTADRPAVPRPSSIASQTLQPSAGSVSRTASQSPATSERPGAATADNAARDATARLNRRPADAVSRPESDTLSVARIRRRPTPSQPLGDEPTRISPEATSPSATSSEAATAAGMTPAPTRVPRLAAGAEAGGQRRPATDTQGASPEPQFAKRSRASSELAQPALTPSSAQVGVPRRSTQDAAVASAMAEANPVETSSPSVSTTAEPSPTQLAVTKGSAGAAGVGERPNLGRAEPAASSPAAVVSGSASRSRATQTTPFGPAMSPNSPAIVRKNRAGRTEPSATLQATPLAVSTRHGSQQPTDLNASSSAALTEAASNAAAGAVTAARGKAEIDFGPTTVVSQAGQGPAAGGGQPETTAGTELARLPRRRSGDDGPASLSTNSLAELPTTPSSEGAASTGTTSPSASPNAIVNSRQGPAAPAAGGRPSLEGSALEGPATIVSNAFERSDSATVAQGSSENSQRTMAMPRTSLRDRNLNVELGAADLGDRGDEAASGQRMSRAGAASASSLALEKQLAGDEPGGARVETSSGAAVANQEAALTGGVAERAEASSASPGIAAPGGGTRSPVRESRGPELVANIEASTIEIEGASPSSGAQEDEPRQSLSDRTASVAGGLTAPRSNVPVGAMRGALPVVAGNLESPGSGQSQITRSEADADGPMIRDVASAGGPRRRTPFIEVPAITSTIAANEMDSGAIAGDSSDAGLAAGSLEYGRLDHSSSASLSVDIQAPEGPGGLGQDTSVEVGIDSRRARPDSDMVKLEGARFARRQVGGMPDFNTAVVVAAEPFRRRATRGSGEGADGDVPGPKTEEAIELGLVFLSRCQEEDGRWRLDRFAGQDSLPQMSSDAAATALVILAFQGAGYNHLEHRYADVVKRGIEFLVENQQPNGDLFIAADDYSNQYVRFYSHSIAALALSEAYGMTQDPELRDPAQRALDFIAVTQHERGGWRYAVGRGSDTSVTGWMMMAMKSGELANLRVDSQVYARIEDWLNRAQASAQQPYLYCYNPYADANDQEQGGGTRPTKTMTSVGLLMRLYLGWRRDNQNLELGARYLIERPPAIGTSRNPQRDTYYWYYATQVLFHMGGQYWKAWRERLHPLLVDSQVRDGELAGSWDPTLPLPDRWGPQAGRLYVSTMNLLSLEVQYRHLPLYDDTAR
jgi:hypothetical protein